MNHMGCTTFCKYTERRVNLETHYNPVESETKNGHNGIEKVS